MFRRLLDFLSVLLIFLRVFLFSLFDRLGDGLKLSRIRMGETDLDLRLFLGFPLARCSRDGVRDRIRNGDLDGFRIGEGDREIDIFLGGGLGTDALRPREFDLLLGTDRRFGRGDARLDSDRRFGTERRFPAGEILLLLAPVATGDLEERRRRLPSLEVAGRDVSRPYLSLTGRVWRSITLRTS